MHIEQIRGLLYNTIKITYLYWAGEKKSIYKNMHIYTYECMYKNIKL